MRTSQEHANALMERMKNAAKNAPVNTPVERGTELFPGKSYQDGYGRVVTITRVGPKRIEYRREGYGKPCDVNRAEFERRFTEMKK